MVCNRSDGSDVRLTITKNTLTAGFNCLIVQKGTDEIEIYENESEVTIYNNNDHTKTADQWAVMTLICIDATTDANVFVTGGDGTS